MGFCPLTAPKLLKINRKALKSALSLIVPWKVERGSWL
jgi:hypothetical protein